MFRQFREEVETAFSAAFPSLDLPTGDLGVEEPPEDIPATLASSVAFRLTGIVGVPPPKITADITEGLSVGGYDYLTMVNTQGPYVNSHVSDAYYDDTLDAVVSDGAYGRLPTTGSGVVVGHTSANPTGPVHVGRIRNSVIGDVVANLLDFIGNDIDRHYHVNDADRQVTTLTWAYETFDKDDLESRPARERAEYDLVYYYRKGDTLLEETDPEEVEWAGTEIVEILQGIEEGDEETYVCVETMVDQVLGDIRECLGRLPAEFNKFVKETRFMFDGSTRDLAEYLRGTDHAVHEEDAWQLELDDCGFEKNLVFLRSDDTSLYTTRDLVHHRWKFDNYNRAVTVLGEGHKLQSDQLRAALNILGDGVDKLEDVIHSWVNLPGGETMSTRKGTGVMPDDLLDETTNHARGKVEARLEGRIRGDDFDRAGIDRITRQVGIGAVRYSIVSKQPTKTITFEWDQVLNFEAQSAPYIQYVHTHCCGIVDEATAAGLDASETGPAVLTTDAGCGSLATIAWFPAVAETVADDLEPHTMVTFACEFAGVSNIFYRECPVLDADKKVGATRLALMEASRNVVANALAIVSVEAPEST